MNHTKEQKINIIWRNTHQDYRGTIGSSPSIMFNGGVCAIESLPDDAFEDRYKAAMEQMERDKIRQLATSLFARHGFAKVDGGAINQWCTSFNGVRDLIAWADDIPGEKKELLKAELDRLEEAYSSDKSIEAEPSL